MLQPSLRIRQFTIIPSRPRAGGKRMIRMKSFDCQPRGCGNEKKNVDGTDGSKRDGSHNREGSILYEDVYTYSYSTGTGTRTVHNLTGFIRSHLPSRLVRQETIARPLHHGLSGTSCGPAPPSLASATSGLEGCQREGGTLFFLFSLPTNNNDIGDHRAGDDWIQLASLSPPPGRIVETVASVRNSRGRDLLAVMSMCLCVCARLQGWRRLSSSGRLNRKGGRPTTTRSHFNQPIHRMIHRAESWRYSYTLPYRIIQYAYGTFRERKNWRRRKRGRTGATVDAGSIRAKDGNEGRSDSTSPPRPPFSFLTEATLRDWYSYKHSGTTGNRFIPIDHHLRISCHQERERLGTMGKSWE